MIVFDSSTIVLLAKVELLDLIISGYKGDITISKEVENESTIKGSFDALMIKKRIDEGKIKVTTIKTEEIEKFMKDFNMDRGEAESVALAQNKNVLLATDDKKAINACKLLGVQFTTAIDFLIRAYEKELITQETALTKLNELSKFGRYKTVIIEDAQNKIRRGERHAKNT